MITADQGFGGKRKTWRIRIARKCVKASSEVWAIYFPGNRRRHLLTMPTTPIN